jgi:hypothetical protein
MLRQETPDRLVARVGERLADRVEREVDPAKRLDQASLPNLVAPVVAIAVVGVDFDRGQDADVVVAGSGFGRPECQGRNVDGSYRDACKDALVSSSPRARGHSRAERGKLALDLTHAHVRDQVVADQIAYYRARAPWYDDVY